MTKTKGESKRGGKPGNRNTVNGPRLGRKDKPITDNVAAPALPQPRADAKIPIPQGLSHPKPEGSGRDYKPGKNSHDGMVFRRGADQLPRGNFTLFAKCVYHDERETLYRRFVQIGRTGTNREVLAMAELLGNRIEGLPTKKVGPTVRRESKFYLTMKDGTVIPALPEKVGGGATPVAASAEDAMILGLQPVRL